MNEEKQEHPSYGLISASHVSGTRRLVGSPFNHQHSIEITLNEAHRYRNLSREWWHPTREIASVMSVSSLPIVISTSGSATESALAVAPCSL